MHYPDSHLAAGGTDESDIEVAVLDANGVIVAVNGPWTDFCEANEGNPASTGVGVNYLEVCQRAGSDPAAQRVAAAIHAALIGATPVAERIKIACHSPNEQRWFDVYVTSRAGRDGQAIGATVMLTQVPEPRTDVVDADHSLAWDLLEALPDALVMADDDGVIESINRPGERLFGCDRAELIGRPLESVLSGASEHEEYQQVELSALRPDGYEIPVEVSINRQEVRGQLRLIVSVRDISGRRRAERRAREIDRCIDGASDAILVLDEHRLRFAHVNSGAAEMFGYDRSEMVGAMSPADLAPELSLAELIAALARLRHTPGDHVRITTIGQTKRGRQLPIEVQINWPAPASPNGHRPVVAIVRRLSGV